MYGFGNIRFRNGETGLSTIIQFLIIHGTATIAAGVSKTIAGRMHLARHSTNSSAKTMAIPPVYLMAKQKPAMSPASHKYRSLDSALHSSKPYQQTKPAKASATSTYADEP